MHGRTTEFMDAIGLGKANVLGYPMARSQGCSSPSGIRHPAKVDGLIFASGASVASHSVL
jgi:hypothetical protein